jgi:CBS domain-containing protein
MGKGVVTVLQDTKVSRAIAAMDKNNIGSVVVLDVLGPCGVFTERDLLSKVLRRGMEPGSTVLAEVLSPAFPAVDASVGLEAAAKAMTEKRSRLMVFEGADLVGMLTPTDIVRAVSRLGIDFRIEGVVTRRVSSAQPETPVDLVARQMDERRIGSVLVSEEGRFTGIFTERDLVKKILAPGRRLDTRLGEVASAPVVVGRAGMGGLEAAGIMARRRIKRLPLSTDEEAGGIVTARDLVEAFAASSGKRAGPRVDWVQWN